LWLNDMNMHIVGHATLNCFCFLSGFLGANELHIAQTINMQPHQQQPMERLKPQAIFVLKKTMRSKRAIAAHELRNSSARQKKVGTAAALNTFCLKHLHIHQGCRMLATRESAWYASRTARLGQADPQRGTQEPTRLRTPTKSGRGSGGASGGGVGWRRGGAGGGRGGASGGV
jgi:uncharacterized membrane protein YgcG